MRAQLSITSPLAHVEVFSLPVDLPAGDVVSFGLFVRDAAVKASLQLPVSALGEPDSAAVMRATLIFGLMASTSGLVG